MPMSRSRKVALIVLGVIVALCLIVSICIFSIYLAVRSTAPVVRENSVLVLRVKGDLPDYSAMDFASRFLGAEDNSLTGLMTEIRKAKVDRRISAILLEIDMPGAGWGKADEIRDGIADFRASGKPIYAYMEIGTNKELYLASACDKIFVAPTGDLLTTGLAAEVMFFRGSLDKLGIYPDVVKIGAYKNAPDQFTRKDMSDAHKEVVNAVLDEEYNRYVEAIAASRHKTADDVRALIDNAPYTAAGARDAGLIDGASYRSEVENELKKRLGYKDNDELRVTKESDYARVSPESVGLNMGERIAVIFASGDIVSGSSGSETVGSDSVARELKKARDDNSIKAIVLRVDSPGGSSIASGVISNAVEAAKRKKPVVVSMGDLGASGGYYISANASRIVAEPSTITGSIGIFAGKPVMKGFYDWLGISPQYVTKGKNAGLLREDVPFTTEERARFQALIQAGYDDFLNAVAKGRNRSVADIDAIGQGRVWTGAQARERGLVDEFGGLERAIQVAKGLAGIPAEKSVHRVMMPTQRTVLDEFFGRDDDSAKDASEAERLAIAAKLPADMRHALRYAAMLQRIERGEMMAMMPFDLRIK